MYNRAGVENNIKFQSTPTVTCHEYRLVSRDNLKQVQWSHCLTDTNILKDAHKPEHEVGARKNP